MPLRNVWFSGHNKPPSASPIVGHVQESFPVRVQDEPLLSASLSPSEVFIEEKERMKRVACREAAYNEASCGDLAKINQAIPCDVLDFDPEKETELLTVDKEFSMKLKSHQIEGVLFMWNACFESIERIKEHLGFGCILAHCMGLGKSLQIVTLVHIVLTNEACQVCS
jgi:transcriptional regulator ATRX